MRWTLLAVVCVAWLPPWTPPACATETGEVVIEAIGGPCIAGFLIRAATGLRFETCKDGPGASVRVAALSGEELIDVRQENGDVLISVESRALTLRASSRELEAAAESPSPSLALAKLNSALQVWGDPAAIAELARTREYALLPELSYQLGKAGITGRAYPQSLPLHAIALGAAKQLGIDPVQADVSYRFELPLELDLLQPPWSDARGSPDARGPDAGPPDPGRPACEAFPNADTNCYGMCGLGCDQCWPWVCGDCCYHAFCALHDELARACEENGNPIVCLNVLPWYFILGGCDGPLFRDAPG
jgi:hypothetical protein